MHNVQGAVDDAHDTISNEGDLLAMCQLATASFDDRVDTDKQKKGQKKMVERRSEYTASEYGQEEGEGEGESGGAGRLRKAVSIKITEAN